jgi:hypothetical protein
MLIQPVPLDLLINEFGFYIPQDEDSPAIMSYCSDPYVVEDVEIPDHPDFDTERLNSALERVRVGGFYVSAYVSVLRESPLNFPLELMGLGSQKFALAIEGDLRAKTATLSIGFPEEIWSEGAMEEGALQLRYQVEFSKKFPPVPAYYIAADLKIRLGSVSDKLLWVKGSLSVSALKTSGSLTLISPSVIPLSRRMALVSTKSDPTKFEMEFIQSPPGWKLALEAQMVFNKKMQFSFSRSAATNHVRYCRSNCIVGKIALEIFGASTVPPVVTLSYLALSLRGDITLPNVIQAVLGVDLPSSLTKSLNGFGMAKLIAIKFDPANGQAGVALAAQTSDMAFMIGFDAKVGAGGFSMQLRTGFSAGCLGFNLGGCTGLKLSSALSSSQRRSKFNAIRSQINNIGWPGLNIQPYLPWRLNHANKLAGYGEVLVSTSKGLRAQVAFKGSLSAFGFDLASVGIPSLAVNVKMANDELALSYTTQSRFVKFTDKMAYSIPRLWMERTMSLSIDILGPLKSVVRRILPWSIFWFLDKVLNLFNLFRLNDLSFGMSTTKVQMSVDAVAFGIPLKFGATIKWGDFQSVMKGNFWAIVKIIGRKITDLVSSPCSPIPNFGSRREKHRMPAILMGRFWGVNEQYYQPHLFYCGIAFKYQRWCGRHIFCGLECGNWCGFWFWYPRCSFRCYGRRRWWGGGCSLRCWWARRWVTTWCCPRFRSCCLSLWLPYMPSCRYVEILPWKFQHHEVSHYTPTVGLCTGWPLHGRAELNHVNHWPYFNYKMHSHYAAEDRWAYHHRRRDWCDTWGNCNRRRTRRRRR